MKPKPCKICSHKADAFLDKQFNNTYYYCPYCKYIFIGESHFVDPEKEAALYRQHENTSENLGYVNMFKDFLRKTIAPFEDRIHSALDFGCGPGPVLAEIMREKGFAVDVYDPYFAPEKTFTEKKYDLITSTEVFEHLSDPLGTAVLLGHHLKEGGILAVMTLFHSDNLEQFLQWWYRRDPTHISFYRPSTFKILAEKTKGLRVAFYDEKNTIALRKI